MDAWVWIVIAVVVVFGDRTVRDVGVGTPPAPPP